MNDSNDLMSQAQKPQCPINQWSKEAIKHEFDDIIYALILASTVVNYRLAVSLTH